MKRADQIVSAIAWTILASVMFAMFGPFLPRPARFFATYDPEGGDGGD